MNTSSAPHCSYVFFVAFLASLILFYHFPSRILDGYLWAEDVRVFLSAAYRDGFRSFGELYAGYLHTIPRLIVYVLARTTRAKYLPFAMVYVSLIISALASAVVYLAAMRLPWRNPQHAVAWSSILALGLLLVPQSGETALNVTNLQWVLAPALIGLLYLAPQVSDRVTTAVVALAVALIALTGPFGVFLAPFAMGIVALRWRSRPAPCTVVIFACYGGAALIQLVALLPALLTGETPIGVHLATNAVNDLVTSLMPDGLISIFPSAPYILVAVIAAATCWAMLTSKKRPEVIALLLYAAVLWVASTSKMGKGSFVWYGDGARYTLLPYTLLLWIFLIMAGTTASIYARCILIAAVTVLLLANPSDGSHKIASNPVALPTVISTDSGYQFKYGPDWTDTLSSGRLRIRP